MRTVHLEHHYSAQSARVWAMATDFEALKEVSRRIVTFDGVPKGRTKAGQAFDVRVSLFGFLPWQDYHMEVVELDEANMLIRSSERGAGVKSWSHTMQVSPCPDGGTTLSDTIEIDAGWLTPVFAAWARFLYRARHKPRLDMLERGAF